MCITYFITEAERKRTTRSTCFFEFQKGKHKRWGRNRFWKEDSLLLYMDIFDQLDLHTVFLSVLPDFDYCGETLVTRDQYEILKNTASLQSSEIAALFAELDVWVTECFKTESCFTILGI